MSHDKIKSSLTIDLLSEHYLGDEGTLVRDCVRAAALDDAEQKEIADNGAALVRRVRAESEPTLMESFLTEYGLSTDEGVALMCLAEALLRVPDAATIDDLIADKIASSQWDTHSGQASSVLVNASTWALMLTGKVLNDEADQGLLGNLRRMIRRVGEPVIRAAVSRAMQELGEQFVLGENIESAQDKAASWETRGYTFSYDMLGEGARTDSDAKRYHLAYADAITSIARSAGGDVRANPGISVKLSALHPRFEASFEAHYFDTLLARTRSLAILAAGSNIGFNIDAEEADRLAPTLRIVEALLREPALAGWDGLGIVVQAYGRRARAALDWLYREAEKNDRRIMVRLVKGAYWDTEVKRAQVLGLESYPVFTRKAHTDIAYIACANALLGMADRIYPQFASHNAHTLAAIIHLAERHEITHYELQRLHGMGEALHEITRTMHGTRTRIYAPVGVHQDLLAYLVRRLLENGANSSFVHQIVDERVSPETVACNPFEDVHNAEDLHNPRLRKPPALFADRRNARGWDLHHGPHVEEILNARAESDCTPGAKATASSELKAALERVNAFSSAWAATRAEQRATALERAAELFERHFGDFFSLMAREAKKTLPDAVSELREAVDFLRFYAGQCRSLQGSALGVVACISPWNFPLAIFTGQIAANLAAGNSVIAKPAEQTPAIAALAVQILYEAGIPQDALQLAIGPGSTVGNTITQNRWLAGVCFTGSLDTARIIHRNIAEHALPDAVMIAETGGINAMIVDSTALAEQAVRDIITSSFQSAGQRCSALRMLYIQEDVAEHMLSMIRGAMDALVVGDPWRVDTDVGPVIDADAYAKINAHIRANRIIHQASGSDSTENLIIPTLIEVNGIEDLKEEVFGPVLHVATFNASDLDRVIEKINASGYGLTFGLHTRLDDRVQHVVDRLQVGNIYVNRNQIGAVVESQPFGGEGLSGTGPKAGGYHYLPRLRRYRHREQTQPPSHARVGERRLNSIIKRLTAKPFVRLRTSMPMPEFVQTTPGPTGEGNTLSLHPRGAALCLGPDTNTLLAQAECALACGCPAVLFGGNDKQIRHQLETWESKGLPIAFVKGLPTERALTDGKGFQVLAYAGDDQTMQFLRNALAARSGSILRFTSEPWEPMAYLVERHVCTDTTAAGGNTKLMTGTE